MIDDDQLRLAFARRFLKLRIGVQRQLQHAFVAAAEHRQRAVRRHLRNRFVMIEIVAELGAFFFLALDDFGHQMGVFPQVVAHLGQQRGVFGEALHQDIARAVEGGFDVRHALVGIDVAFSQLFRLLLRILPQRVRQRFQTGLDGDLAAGAALRFVRQVEVFEFGLAQRGVDRPASCSVSLPCSSIDFRMVWRRSSSSRR